MITGALCQSMSFGVNPNNVIGTLCFWRFLLGVGIGGNYPLRCPTPHAACAAILRRHPLALFTRSCARMHSPRTRAAPAIDRSHPRPAAGMTHCALRRRAAARSRRCPPQRDGDERDVDHQDQGDLRRRRLRAAGPHHRRWPACRAGQLCFRMLGRARVLCQSSAFLSIPMSHGYIYR